MSPSFCHLPAVLILIAMPSMLLHVSTTAAAMTPPPAGDASIAGTHDIRTGDVVTDVGGISVEVPTSGFAVEAISSSWLGAGQSMTVTSDAQGTVSVSGLGDEGIGDAGLFFESSDTGETVSTVGSTTPIDPCTDTAYGYLGRVAKGWNATMKWYWTGVNPGTGTGSQFLTDIKDATSSIVNARNSCGLADQVSATASYQGTTGASKVNISSTATCTTRDGISALGAGTLPESIIGYACIWRNSNGYIVESDIKLNTGSFTWGHYRYFVDTDKDAVTLCKNARASSSSTVDANGNRLVVAQDLMTHERGHSYGLADLTSYADFNLTMSAYQGGCTKRHVTLGKGDIVGLNGIY